MGLIKVQPDASAAAMVINPPGGRALPSGAALLSRLAAADAGERRRAALLAGADPTATAALCRRLGVEPDSTVREAILTSLMALRSAAAVEGLLPYLHSDAADLRNGVVEALQAMPGLAVPALEVSLRDPDPDIRIVAVTVLAAMPGPEVRRLLLAVIDADTDVNVCAAAVDGLVNNDGPEAAAPLERVKARFPDEPHLAFAVDVVLRRIRDR